MSRPDQRGGSYGSFRAYVDAIESRERTLRVLNREQYDPVYELLEQTMASDDVTVVDDETATGTPVDVLRLEDREGVALATSDFPSVRDTLLLVNSDLYVTGTRSLGSVETPDAVARLEDTTFEVAGRSKFLLIHISRQIEALARDTGAGVLHTGFQRLSRIGDEVGTLAAYRELEATDVATHVYGVPDWERTPVDGLHVHAHRDGEIPDTWFVVHDGGEAADRPPAAPGRRKAALVAVETSHNEYRGFWTFDATLVDDVLAYVERRYC